VVLRDTKVLVRQRVSRVTIRGDTIQYDTKLQYIAISILVPYVVSHV